MPAAAVGARVRAGQKGGFARGVIKAVVKETAELIGSAGDFTVLETISRRVPSLD